MPIENALPRTEEEIDAHQSPNGGFTKATLAKWGVTWPPKKGWRKALLEGRDPNNPDFEDIGLLEASPIREGISAHDLLRKVVIAVIERGHASDLYALPDVLAYFGAQMPEGQETTTAPLSG